MCLNIHGLINNARCYQMVRRLRWPEGVECPHCHATTIVKNGPDETQPDRQRFLSGQRSAPVSRGNQYHLTQLTQFHAVSIISSGLVYFGFHPSSFWALSELAYNRAGSPSRRGP